MVQKVISILIISLVILLFLVTLVISVLIVQGNGYWEFINEQIRSYLNADSLESPNASIRREESGTDIFRLIITACSLYPICFIAIFVLYKKFRRNGQIPIIIILLFVCSLSFGGVRVLAIFLWFAESSQWVVSLFSKIDVYLYFTGLFSAFYLSIRTREIKENIQIHFLLLIVVIAGLLSFLIPVHTQSLSANFLFGASYSYEILWTSAGLVFVALLGIFFLNPFVWKNVMRFFSAILLMLGIILVYSSFIMLQSILGCFVLYLGIFFQYRGISNNSALT